MLNEQLVNYNIDGLHNKFAEVEILCRQRTSSGWRATRHIVMTWTADQAKVAWPSWSDVIPSPQAAWKQPTTRPVQKWSWIYRRPNILLGPAKELIRGIRHRRKGIIMGDLNARPTSWNCLSDNELGKFIFQQPIIVILPGVHTFRHSTNSSWTSTLDHPLNNSPH